MGPLLTPETFEFFARYLLAGFIIASVRSRFVRTAPSQPTELLFGLVVLSLLNQVAFGAATWGLDVVGIGPWGGRAAFIVEVLAFPLAVGLLFGLILRRGRGGALMRRLALPFAQPSQNAWDRLFAAGVKPGLVLITYRDGTRIMGWFGAKSFAASAERDRDIYIETLYEMYGDEPDEWVESHPSRSAYVTLDDVRSIEFIEGDDGDDGDDVK